MQMALRNKYSISNFVHIKSTLYENIMNSDGTFSKKLHIPAYKVAK
jgi:hypothetical protein